MQPKRRYPPELIFSLLALTLAILAVGTLYVRDLVEEVSPPSYSDRKTVRPLDLETVRPSDLETSRPLDLETVRPSDLETSRPLDLETVRPSDLKKNIAQQARGSGKVAFYMTCRDCPPVEIFIEGKSVGTLNGPYTGNGPPSCGSKGTLTKELPAGRYHVSAKDENGKSFDAMITVVGGKCELRELRELR